MKKKFIEIDGSFGEGGGQILRTSLALSMITGKAIKITKIRAGRQKDGLLRQHLCCLRAAAEISNAEVTGDELRSTEFTFAPQKISAGKYKYSIGSAGSTSLVLQTILPALLYADAESEITIEGGTHNMAAPSFDFLDKCFFPQLRKMGVEVEAKLEKYGFYPAGGGRIVVTIKPIEKWRAIEINKTLSHVEISAEILMSKLDLHIAEREAKVLRSKLSLGDDDLKISNVESQGPGNVLQIIARSDELIEVFTDYGRQGKLAEGLAKGLCKKVQNYLQSEAPVDEYLADQLLLPMALAGAGSFTCTRMSRHSKTNMEIIKRFLSIDFTVTGDKKSCKVELSGNSKHQLG